MADIGILARNVDACHPALARARLARPLVVLKFGSSVLGDGTDLSEIVGEIYRWLRANNRVLAIVSAFEGETDRLLREAADLGAPFDNRNAPALVALGEENSAARLALACDRAGISAVAMRPSRCLNMNSS